jgi:hypothetical protein
LQLLLCCNVQDIDAEKQPTASSTHTEIFRGNFPAGSNANSYAVVTINGWNRLCVSFRAVPVTYQPVKRSGSAG